MFEKIFSARKTEKTPEDPERREFLRSIGTASIGLMIHGSALSLIRGQEPRVQTQVTTEQPVEQFSAEDWSAYKRTIASSKVRENLAYLEQKYGDELHTIIKDTKLHLETFDRVVAKEQKGEDISRDVATLAALTDYKLFYSIKEALSRGREIMVKATNNPPTIQGFELEKDFTNSNVRKRLEKAFGLPWLFGGLDKLIYHDEEKMGKTFGYFATAGNRQVDLFKYPFSEYPAIFLRIMSHELAHLHDWGESAVLTIPERINFLRETTEIFERRDGYKDPYVEKDIPNENKELSKQAIVLAQAREFWAVLNEAHHNYQLKGYRTERDFVIKWRKLIISRFSI